MSEVYEFKAVIENAGGGGAYVRIPFDVEQTFGEKRVKIQATIDGEPYRGLLVRMGMDSHVLIVLKEIRQKIGKTFGEDVAITLRKDTEPRVVNIPADVQDVLDRNPEALAAFRKLSYTHQKEYVSWIESAKRQVTREDRLARMAGMLVEGKTNP
jgi:tetrahydromethanopterin S-methyltransferase subunit G